MITEERLKNEMLRIFEELISVMELKKKIKREEIASKILYELYNMTENNKSKVFTESALLIDSEVAEMLLEKGNIQKIIVDEQEKYALTFKGISRCINIKYGRSLEEQFLDFLKLADKKFYTLDQTKLSWDEKLVTLSLILLISTSEISAIRLNVEKNKPLLKEVFEKTLICMKKFETFDKNYELKSVKRGEDPVCAILSRVNALPRKRIIITKSWAKIWDIILI